MSVLPKQFLDTLSISEGQRLRTNCPVCGGRNTFTVIKADGVLVYNCFKLGCRQGMYAVGLTAAEIKEKMKHYIRPVHKEVERMEIPEYLVQPTDGHPMMQAFMTKWDLHDEGLMYDVKDRRCVFPIKHKGRIIDANGRSLDGALPKWYRYTGKASYFTRTFGHFDDVAVVVEDTISAITVAKIDPRITGFAILGTSLLKVHADALSRYSKVIVALDPDAWGKTMTFTKHLRLYGCEQTKALLLKDDLKYKLDEDLIKIRGMIDE